MSRHKSAGRQGARLCLNGKVHSDAEGYSNINVNATLKLKKNDKVHVELFGQICDAFFDRSNYFEGRMIARLDQ